jgi:hypothetical protein
MDEQNASYITSSSLVAMWGVIMWGMNSAWHSRERNATMNMNALDSAFEQHRDSGMEVYEYDINRYGNGADWHSCTRAKHCA